jgi:hypothetical protein
VSGKNAGNDAKWTAIVKAALFEYILYLMLF